MVQLCSQQLQMEQYVYGRSVNASQDVIHTSVPELPVPQRLMTNLTACHSLQASARSFRSRHFPPHAIIDVFIDELNHNSSLHACLDQHMKPRYQVCAVNVSIFQSVAAMVVCF